MVDATLQCSKILPKKRPGYPVRDEFDITRDREREITKVSSSYIRCMTRSLRTGE
jgi:hypothetical protein